MTARKRAQNGKPSADDLLPVAAERLSYDPHSGLLRWHGNYGARAKAGKIAGSVRKDGYILVRIDGRPILAHRVAFYIMHGYCPRIVDHASGNPSDNRGSNLREATQRQNTFNSSVRSDNPTGVRGVIITYCKDGSPRYLARIMEGGSLRHLGTFRDPVAAWLHRVAAAMRLHGEFVNESNASGMPAELAQFISDEQARTGRPVWRPAQPQHIEGTHDQ